MKNDWGQLMRHFYRVMLIVIGLFVIVMGEDLSIKAEPIRPEVRAIWVDAFHDGAKTPDQIDKLIKDCLTANINTLIVQVRRRGDAYYNQSIEPRTEDPKLPQGFDALQYLIDKAHANHMEIHAWLNTLVAWNSSVPPKNPDHVWNQHGPKASARANWIAYYRTYDKTHASWSEKVYSSYFLDPGNPDALDYTVDVYLNVVKHYDVDGIHLDYSRYDGMGWGYNPTSVARFNAQYGTTGLPAPDDPRWLQWRREQTANLVRKIYLKAIAIKPGLKVSSAVITWGDGPVVESDWEKSRNYNDVAQDWLSWLREGIIDMVIPMNYFNEWNPIQQGWFNRWIEWEKDHQYGRQIVIGPGIFSQYIEQSLDQIRRAQAPSALGNHTTGVALYAYAWDNLYSNDDFRQPASAKILPRQPHVYMPETNEWLFPLLASPGSYLDPVLHQQIVTESVFSSPVPVPDMPWKSHPFDGYLMGTVSGFGGKTYDHLLITVESANFGGSKISRQTFTDGSGWFGLSELPPGEYFLRINHPDFAGQRPIFVGIQPGKVTEADVVPADR